MKIPIAYFPGVQRWLENDDGGEVMQLITGLEGRTRRFPPLPGVHNTCVGVFKRKEKKREKPGVCTVSVTLCG